ncbi:MAG: hypothetical protein GY804_09650 [Alphaproteobacteria bacterium]|nr:hypothetical protein [Alphaproteobacteria bacterium]
MNQDKLRLLAEWYWGNEISDMVLPDECNFIYVELKTSIGKSIYFDPLEDSNQLDMLKKKFIKEAGIKSWSVNRYSDNNFELGLFRFMRSEPDVSNGKDDGECWLNAILNYVEGL